MGILQGDSPTPGPAMYWQPYHTEETATRIRPTATGDDLSGHNNNNNNNNETDVKMIQQHNAIVGMEQTSFYNPHHLHHLHHLVKEEREETRVEECRSMTDDSVNSSIKAQEPTETSQSGTSSSVPAICAGCSFKIADRYYLVAVDKAWHSECLRCDECRRPLDTALSCFARQSRIYCRDDYHRLFGGRKQCAKCCETLQPDELVMRGREHLFHTRCFSCHVCQTHLIKGSTFGMVGALIYCQQHYQPGPAQQGFNVNQHNNAINNNVNNSHHDISGHSLSQQPAESYMTMTPHHQEPFGGSPHHHHFDHHLHHQYGQSMVQPSSEAMETSGKLYGSPASASPAASLKNQRIRTKRRPSAKSEMISLMNEREDDSFMSVDGAGLLDTSSSSPSSMLGSCVMMGGTNQQQQQVSQQQQQQNQQQQQQQKTKRLRTSFKHHQLRMLKSYFATNHNPDAKDLKQLSQKTTLSKRVLQVWFQNARAKWRRLVQKTEGGSGANANNNSANNNGGGHNMSSSSSTSSNCSGSGNETGSPVPSSSASPSHVRQIHGHHQPIMMANFMDHHQQQQHHHHMMTSSLSRSRMSLYDEISLSGSSSVASVGFPSPL